MKPIDLDLLLKEAEDHENYYIGQSEDQAIYKGMQNTRAEAGSRIKALISVVRKQREALKDVLREIEIGDQGHDNAVIYTNSPNIKNAREVLSLTARAKEEK